MFQLPFFAVYVFATAVASKNITYNVISLVQSDQTMGVVVDNTTYPLTRSHRAAILFAGEAPAAKVGYYFAKMNGSQVVESESFQRNKVLESTPNEFYNRTWNSRQIAPLPQVFDPLSVIERPKSKLHVDGQIPVVYIFGNASGIDLMHSNSTEDIQVTVNMTHISLDDVQTFSNVEIELAGRSSRWFPKVSYNIKLSKKDGLYGYRRFKLRAMATDPSYLREQVAYDVIKSTGVPSTESSFVRVFINDRAFGLFGFIENYKKPWYSIEFGEKKDGLAYQGVGGLSDLSHYANESQYATNYKIKSNPNKDEGPGDYQKLIDLTKFIAQQPTNSKDTTKEWEKWFNMDSVIRNMALEILLGYADGYSVFANNYYLYYYTAEKRFIYIPSDLDLVMGSTIAKLDRMWSGNYTDYPGFLDRPMTAKLYQIPQYRRQLEDTIVKLARDLMNPCVMSKRVDDLTAMIREDVVWDHSLPPINHWSNMLGGDDSAGANGLPSALPPTWDNATIVDFGERMVSGIPFETAVNGPTGHISLAGIKEWITHQSQNLLRFLKAPSTATCG